MADTTTHHGWPIPEDEGDVDEWGEILNSLIGEIDEETILKGGTSGSPPTPDEDPGTAGRWYLATDTTVPGDTSTALPYLFYDDGAKWVEIWTGEAYRLDGVDAANFARTDVQPTFAEGIALDVAPITGVSYIAAGRADAGFDTYGGGTGEFSIYDTANAQYIAHFREGGEVEISNGTLTANGVNLNYNALSNVGFAGIWGDIQPYDGDGTARSLLYDYANGHIPYGTVQVDPRYANLSESNDFGILPTVNGARLATEGYADSTVTPASEHARMVNFPTMTIPEGDHAEQRIRVPSGATLELVEMGIQTTGGATSADFMIAAYDADGFVEGTSSKQYDATGTITGADDVVFRLRNDGTGGDQNLTGFVAYQVV